MITKGPVTWLAIENSSLMYYKALVIKNDELLGRFTALISS